MSQRRFYNEGQADSPMSQEDEKESKYYLKKLLEIGKKKKDTSLKKELKLWPRIIVYSACLFHEYVFALITLREQQLFLKHIS